MQSLQEQQLVMVSIADTRGRADRGIPCVAVAVSRAYAALYSLTEMRLDHYPAAIGEVFLSYRRDRRLVALRGVAQALSRNDLRFAPLDMVPLSRRRAARLQASASVDLKPLDSVHSWRTVSTESVDVSGTGLLCVRRGDFHIGDLVRFEMSFGEDLLEHQGPPIKGVARVLRTDSNFAALDFKDVDAFERRRLTEHIIAVKRRALERSMTSLASPYAGLDDKIDELPPEPALDPIAKPSARAARGQPVMRLLA